jgi:hypothetical protein
MSEVGRRAGAAPDDRATVRRQRAGCGSKAKVVEDEPVSEASIQDSSPEAGGYGLSRRSVLVAAEDRLVRPFPVRAGEAAWSVAVARGDAFGVQLGADPADRCMSERGKRPGGAVRTVFGAGAPSVAVGACRRTRSSRGSNDPPGRAGKPSTGRRWSSEHAARSDGRRSPVNTGAPLPCCSGYSTSNASCTVGDHPGVLMESRMRWKSQVRFGGRRRGDHRSIRPASAPRRRPCVTTTWSNTSAFDHAVARDRLEIGRSRDSQLDAERLRHH